MTLRVPGEELRAGRWVNSRPQPQLRTANSPRLQRADPGSLATTTISVQLNARGLDADE